jgi:hypothetical protein
MANDDSYQAIKCPSCSKYISNQVNTCRFCSTLLTDEMKTQAIEAEQEESRQHRLKSNKTFLYVGIGIFALGTLLLLVSIGSILFTPEGRFFIWSPFIMVFGLGQIIYGLFGVFEERKRK